MITTGIIVVILVTSTLIFFSLTTSILESKISNSLLRSSYDFVFKLQEKTNNLENKMAILDFDSLEKNLNIDTMDVDFIFPLTKKLDIDKNLMRVSNDVYLNFSSFNVNSFIKNNPNLLLSFIEKNNRLVLGGVVIDEEMLNNFSDESRIEIVLLINEIPIIFSEMQANTQYLTSLINASKDLTTKENFSLYTEELTSGELYASIYYYDNSFISNNRISFLLYITSNEVFTFRETMGMIMLILLFAGIALSLIFVMFFTTKFRKQITSLNEAAESASRGDFNKKVKIITKDEIGRLGAVFNQMLAELSQKEKREKEYADFLTLLNQNPSLLEISGNTLSVMIQELGLQIGAFYLVEDGYEILKSVHGIDKENFSYISDAREHKEAIEKQQPVELNLDINRNKIFYNKEEIELRYSIIIPIVYYKTTIAVIEIAGNNHPLIPSLEYINIIHDQLAVGIINAKTFEQLQLYVNELKILNTEYQKQNTRITEKNEQLIKLHTELRLKAEELENEKSKAIELTKIKSHFLASVSHELRTPLNSIIGLTELVSNDEKIGTEAKKRLKIVLKSGQKLLSLINNILDYLKIESGKLDLKKESFILSLFLKDIVQFIEPLVKEKNLRFLVNYNIDTDLVLITDKSKLEQVIINLIGNAVKFTNNGEIILSVSLLADKELKFSVKDTGVGIKKENLEIIFEEFRQGDGGTKRKYEGTGLGLSISKEYTRLLGGEIYVESEYGKGSEFFLLFRNMVFEKVDSYEKLVFPVINFSENENERYVMFFVESEKTQKIVHDYLVLNKFRVITSSEPECKFEENKRSLPIAVIIDIEMMKGNLRILNKLKNDQTANLIPLIIIGINENEKTGYGLNVFDYYNSPLTPEIIINKTNAFSETFNLEKVNIIVVTNNPSKIITEPVIDDNLSGIKYIPYENNILDKITQTDADVLFINLPDDSENTVELINQIKHSQDTKHLSIICGLPEFDPVESRIWVNTFNDVMSRVKHHPLDVLKVIRDRLGNYFEDFEYLQNNKIEISQSLKNVKKINDKTGKILLVDDDPDTLYTIGELLHELNCDFVTASNGVECLVKLADTLPSLILLDIMMPQMDGFETIKRIKADDNFNKIPVIALTAYAMLENRDVIDKHGFEDIITKPVMLESLNEKINKYIK